MYESSWFFLILTYVLVYIGCGGCAEQDVHVLQEEDWGDKLKILTTFQPQLCDHRAKKSDMIHYHYVGRLGDSGQIFGRSFDYNSPYIVSLGHGRIIAGMDRGLMNMCLWERRRITIPPRLGYGDRGVGQVIPPNATLVFYVRLIRIERNGHALGDDQRIQDLWESGLDSYSSENWEQVVDILEEAVRLFNMYENKTLQCLRQCQNEGSDVTTDPSVQQFLLYAQRGKCVRDCKEKNLPAKLRNPDPWLLQDFRRRLPFSYLHYAYYKLGDFENAAKCCFTFYHYNPTDQLAINSMPFYRTKLQLKNDQFVFREPVIAPHQQAYLEGKQNYDMQHWLESADSFEEALVLYREALKDCYLMCEDIVEANLTQPDMSAQKMKLYEDYKIAADSMEYYELLVTIVKEVLACRKTCHSKMAIIEGSPVEKYFSIHFHFLQFVYFKLGLLHKAAEAASTYLALEPSDDVMARNIRYYTSEYKISAEKFVPRQVYVGIQHRLETEGRILYFMNNGEIQKRGGQRGDAVENSIPPRHEEL